MCGIVNQMMYADAYRLPLLPLDLGSSPGSYVLLQLHEGRGVDGRLRNASGSPSTTLYHLSGRWVRLQTSTYSRMIRATNLRVSDFGYVPRREGEESVGRGQQGQ